DLYFTNSRFGYPNALYLNRGDGTFVDTARAAGLADVNRPGEGVSIGAVWGDFDNDGLEDVLIYKWGYLQLFQNMGNLHFKDVNGDGSPAVFLANDCGPEELYLNDHGQRFVLSRVGLESDSKSGMSAALGDVQSRGRVDAFVTNISEPGYLFHGNNLRLNFLPELGRFQQAAEGVVADAGWAWGAQLGDLDNDGRNELFIVNGYVSGDRDRCYWYPA